MFSVAFFPDSYDLFRPTVTLSASREQTITPPETATIAGQPCKLRPTPNERFNQGRGPEMDHDAVLLYPKSNTELQPNRFEEGVIPDELIITLKYEDVSFRYRVVRSWNAAGRNYYRRATLRQIKAD